MLKSRLAAAFLAAAIISQSATLLAKTEGSLPVPTEGVLLEVTGKLIQSNVKDAKGPVAILDRSMLEGLGITKIETSTDWTDGIQSFEGPLVSDLLERLGASGTTILATAANDYTVEIPVSDFLRYPVILAMEMNGKRLTLRDKGPIWIVYPRDQYPELDDPLINGRWIWQLKRLEIR
ncbi:molybdopterin-dependent oxidoreductase [Pelagibius sp. Alg239-R121]|uniref:molybdopterin-dependent oxidoreductase n=1 Tax=Pelagibius sp. Alg239-R121 TaxID=2993448 RepID=UPI0024A72585|nr:molybdopterin-dependent oxidoreductase [Pelagibius sp. Alg239-R121]